MIINYETPQTINITKIFTGKLDNGNEFSVIASWDSNEWSVDSIMFDEPEDDTEENEMAINDNFNAEMN